MSEDWLIEALWTGQEEAINCAAYPYGTCRYIKNHVLGHQAAHVRRAMRAQLIRRLGKAYLNDVSMSVVRERLGLDKKEDA